MKNFEDFHPVIPNEEMESTLNLDEVRDNYQRLYQMDLSKMISQKGSLSYISYVDIFRIFKLEYPDANYKILKNEKGLPYFVDEEIGIMVFCQVSAGGQTYEMILPVMDSSNRAMKTKPYSYKVWNKNTKQYEEKWVAAATMMDIHKTVLRCITKCISTGWGLALWLYQGLDFPEVGDTPQIESPVADIPNVPFLQENEQSQKQTRKRKTTPPADPLAGIKTIVANTDSMKELVDLYLAHKQVVDAEPTLLDAFTQRKLELNSNAA